jgi:hypothetical protein
MASSVRVKDNGYNALMRRIRKGPAKLTVGIHEAEGSQLEGEDGITVAEVAAMHELGLGQEERSFIRGYVDDNEQQIADDLRKLGEAVISGKLASTEMALERFGLKTVGGIQARISDGIPPENKPSTVAKKGSSTPLIDDGILRSSITHKVES